MLIIRSLIVLAALTFGLAAAAANLPLRVVDGDTLDLGGERIRLFGIDAPEQGQTCDRKGAIWACGAWSSRVLADLVAKGPVTCVEQDRDRYGRSVAICRVAGRDLGAEMVRQGAARAYLRYSNRYLPDENAARRAGAGVWSARMQSPETFRHPAQPIVSPVSGTCAIKGNIGSGGKIYHLPGQRDYAATRINPAKGEAWFCSEAEARAAGFRRARR